MISAKNQHILWQCVALTGNSITKIVFTIHTIQKWFL